MSEIPPNGNEPDGLEDYDEIVQSTVQELFKRFVRLPEGKRINIVSAICLAKALSTGSGLTNEEARLEYLKEYGRNARTMLKSDTSNGDEDEPLFQR